MWQYFFPNQYIPYLVGGFQPLWKILVKMGIFPQIGMKTKKIETTTQIYIYNISITLR